MTINNIALHEVAHAVVGQYFGLAVAAVGVDNNGGGYCSFATTTNNNFIKACVFYAGYYAEYQLDNTVNFNHRRFILDQIEVDETDYNYDEIEDALDLVFDAVWDQIIDWTNRLG